MLVLNAPGKVKVTPRRVRQDARRFKAIPGLSAAFLTEMADNDRANALSEAGDGFTLTHDESGPGKGESAILTNDKLREVIAVHLIKLTDGGGQGRFAHPTYALVVITKAPSGRVTLLTGAHLRAHIEGIWARIPLPDRLRVKVLFRRGKVDPGILEWIEAVHRWRAGVMDLSAEHHVDDIIVAPDGNVDARKKWVREMIHRAWPGLNLVFTKKPDLGSRTVGWVLTTMILVGAGKVHEQVSSDHRAGEYQLRHVNAPHPDHHPKPAQPPPPFEVCTYNGARMDQKTKVAVQVLEQGRLKDLAPLTIFQGCYNPGGVAASAGTHDRGGVLDFSPFEFGRKVKAWRDLFGPGWHREAIPGLWGEHIHCVIADQGNLAPAAVAQVGMYFAGLDGLAGGHRDPNQHHPQVSFHYESAWRAVNAS